MAWLQKSLSSVLNKNSLVYLLVIAHPDDEVMFFSPLLNLIRNKQSTAQTIIHILCLSNGNDEGLGLIRSDELIKCALLHNIDKEQVHIVDNALLQDGMNNIWSTSVVADIVVDYINRLQPNVVVTFDEWGVSGHPNHIATSKGVSLAFSSLQSRDAQILGLKLTSKSLLRKFLGPFDLLLSLCLSKYVVFSANLWQAICGMHLHKSQNLWYRQYFIVLSSFTYINCFEEIRGRM